MGRWLALQGGVYNSKCEVCEYNEWEEVHHQNYDSLDYNNPWYELDEHLLYVCKDCHNEIHIATGKHSSNNEDMEAWLVLLNSELKKKKKIKKEKEKKIKLKIKKKQTGTRNYYERRIARERVENKWNKLSVKEKKEKNLDKYNIELRRNKRIAKKKIEEERIKKVIILEEEEKLLRIEEENKLEEKYKKKEHRKELFILILIYAWISVFIWIIYQCSLVWFWTFVFGIILYNMSQYKWYWW